MGAIPGRHGEPHQARGKGGATEEKGHDLCIRKDTMAFWGEWFGQNGGRETN